MNAQRGFDLPANCFNRREWKLLLSYPEFSAARSVTDGDGLEGALNIGDAITESTEFRLSLDRSTEAHANSSN
jgi:hypothetical protein